MTDEEAQRPARELTFRRTSIERNVRSSAHAPGGGALSLYQLMDPAVLANPYPLYRALRERERVYWDPFLHAWVVTGYAEVLTVLQEFSAERTPTPEQLKAMGVASLAPIAQVMVKQMLFLDGAAHQRLRRLCSVAFTPRRVDRLRSHIENIANRLIDRVLTPAAWISSTTSPRRSPRLSRRSSWACPRRITHS